MARWNCLWIHFLWCGSGLWHPHWHTNLITLTSFIISGLSQHRLCWFLSGFSFRFMQRTSVLRWKWRDSSFSCRNAAVVNWWLQVATNYCCPPQSVDVPPRLFSTALACLIRHVKTVFSFLRKLDRMNVKCECVGQGSLYHRNRMAVCYSSYLP
jgi:hypothetical protein